MADTEPYVPIWQRSPSLQERQQERRATPKYAMTTRLDVKTAKDKDDEKQLEQWRRAVGIRDKYTCRVCEIKTVKTIELIATRGEAHHITGRADKAVRTDVRNGLHVCKKCHDLFTARKLFVVQVARFLFKADNGQTYINGSKKVTFSERAA